MIDVTKKWLLAMPAAFAIGSAGCVSAYAHPVSVAPVHVSGNHNNSSSHGGTRGFWATLFGLDVEPVAAAPGGYGVAMPYGYAGEAAMQSGTMPAIQSDEERYRAATGLALPPRHGLVVVPSATPKGDETYIWSNTGAN